MNPIVQDEAIDEYISSRFTTEKDSSGCTVIPLSDHHHRIVNVHTSDITRHESSVLTDNHQTRIPTSEDDKLLSFMYLETSTISMIKLKLRQAKECLEKADLSFNTEVARESALNMFSYEMFQLTKYMELNSLFRDTLTVFLGIIQTSFSEPITQFQLRKLNEVMEVFIRNPFMGDKERLVIYRELRKANLKYF